MVSTVHSQAGRNNMVWLRLGVENHVWLTDETPFAGAHRDVALRPSYTALSPCDSTIALVACVISLLRMHWLVVACAVIVCLSMWDENLTLACAAGFIGNLLFTFPGACLMLVVLGAIHVVGAGGIAWMIGAAAHSITEYARKICRPKSKQNNHACTSTRVHLA